MVTRSMDKKEAFGNALKELLKDTSCIPLVRQAMIAGWNLSLITTPELVAGIWNEVLPKKLKVTPDAFVDKGQKIDWLTADEMKTIVRFRGGTLDPMKEGFDPFYQWKFINPEPSVVAMEKAKAYWDKRKAPKKNPYGYGEGRYMGD